MTINVFHMADRRRPVQEFHQSAASDAPLLQRMPYLLVFSILFAGCQPLEPPEPTAEQFVAVIEAGRYAGDATFAASDTIRFTDTVCQVRDSSGVFIVELDAGRLALYGLPARPPLQAGRAYRFVYHLYGVEFSLGPMTALRITDVEQTGAEYAEQERLIFLGLQRLRAKIPDDLLPAGWHARLVPSSFARHDTGCGTHSRPLMLTIGHGGNALRLLQRESGRVGAYKVAVQAAQDVRYDDPSCPDYVLPVLSFTVSRIGTSEQ